MCVAYNKNVKIIPQVALLPIELPTIITSNPNACSASGIVPQGLNKCCKIRVTTVMMET